MLLLFLEEELSFWSLVRLIDSDSPREGMRLGGYYKEGMEGLKVDLIVFEILLKKKLPKVLKTLERHMVELQWLCAEWFLCFFCTVFPINTSLRVWDSLVLEGHKILFRVALGTFRLCETPFTRLDSLEEIMIFSKTMAKDLVEHNELMKTAFYGIGSLSRNQITRYRQIASRKVIIASRR